MKRCLLTILLALVMALPGLSESQDREVETPPGELEEFDLDAQAPARDGSPEAMAESTPLPTLAPGSINYPDSKLNFEGEIWAILTRRWGLNEYQAAGLMSSLYAESAFCPYNVQNHEGMDNRKSYRFRSGDGVGFGLCQWTNPARKSALRRYAAECGDANLVWDFDIQMAYMRNEIDLKALRGAQTLYDATEWAVLTFERPDQRYENSWPGNRYEIALQIFQNHTGAAYEEPERLFDVAASDGTDATEGFILFEDGELIVTSNYYWRLEKAPAWLEITCPALYDPEKWEPCACGYSGTTRLRLNTLFPPLFPDAELRFMIYRGNGERVRVPLVYTGKGFGEWLMEKRQHVSEMIGRFAMDKS